MVSDHGNLRWMQKAETISVSRFKATCLGVLEKVRKTGRPVVVTKFGKPIAEVVPLRGTRKRSEWLGCRKGTFKIVGDIVGPVFDQDEGDSR